MVLAQVLVTGENGEFLFNGWNLFGKKFWRWMVVMVDTVSVIYAAKLCA